MGVGAVGVCGGDTGLRMVASVRACDAVVCFVGGGVSVVPCSKLHIN